LPGGAEATGTLDVEAALARLPQGARDVLVLVGIYGHSHEEAAAMLGIATGTSKAQLHRARRLMAQQLGFAMEAA
jgi:RNA polymerase sigma-70 factor (ECF subfamily)